MAVANIYRVVQDLEGNVVTGVLGTVTLTGTSTLAALFSDSAGTLALPNPTTNNAQYGSFNLFVAAGTYDMQFVKSGYTFETQRNIVLRDPASGVNTITGTANRVIVAPVPGVGAVTLSTPQDIAPDSTLQFAHLGLGTPGNASYGLDVSTASRFTATMNASAVAITGGQATLDALIVDNPTLLVDPALNSVGFGTAPLAGIAVRSTNLECLGSFTADSPTLMVDPTAHGVGVGTNGGSGYKLTVVGTHWQNGNMGLVALPVTDARLKIDYLKASVHGLTFHPTDNDTSGFPAVAFTNTTGTSVGQIFTNASTTNYATTSDARLKHAVETLTGELDLVKALRPVAFRWNVDDTLGVGFLASEVAALVQGVITGEQDAVDEEGAIKPQMIDMSKLVPWLVGAIQTLVQRLEVVEDAAGV